MSARLFNVAQATFLWIALLSSGFVLPAALGADAPFVIEPAAKKKTSPIAWRDKSFATSERGEIADPTVIAHAKIAGNWKSAPPEASLLVNQKDQVAFAQEGAFEFSIPLRTRVTPFSMTLVAIDGKTQRFDFILTVPETSWTALQTAASTPAPKNATLAWTFVPSLGITSLNYQESLTGFADVDYTAIQTTARINVERVLWRPEARLNASAFGTVVNLSRSAPTDFRVFGGSVRMTYDFPVELFSARLRAGLGGYYNTSTVSGNAFGYSKLGGPQASLGLHREAPDAPNWSAHVRFSPVGKNFALLSLANREMAVGATYWLGLGADAHWGVSAEWVDLRLKIADPTAFEVRSSMLSLSASYRFGL